MIILNNNSTLNAFLPNFFYSVVLLLISIFLISVFFSLIIRFIVIIFLVCIILLGSSKRFIIAGFMIVYFIYYGDSGSSCRNYLSKLNASQI